MYNVLKPFKALFRAIVSDSSDLPEPDGPTINTCAPLGSPSPNSLSSPCIPVDTFSSSDGFIQISSTFLLSEFLFSKMIFNKNLYKFISLPKKLSYIGFKRKLSNLLVIFFQLSGLLLLISSLKKITKITSSYCPFFFKYLFFVLSMQNKTIGRTVISIQNKTISRTVFFNFYYFVFFLIILNSLRFKK